MKQRLSPVEAPLEVHQRGLLPASARSEGSRGLILEEALTLFASKGYGSTTVRDIAAQVGMLSGSLYSHFPAKEMILAELVHIGHLQHSQCLREAVLAAAPGPRNQLIAVVRAHVLFHTQFTTLAIVSNAEVHVLDPALAKPAMDLRRQNLQLFLDLLERGMQLGAFKVVDSILTATIIGSMGARVANWYTPEFHLNPTQIADQMADMVCRLVGSTEP